MTEVADPPARLPQLDPALWTEAVRPIFEVFPGQEGNHVLRTFAQYPQLTAPFLAFNKHLLTSSTLPVRLRQIAILRVAWTRKAVYMWSSHLRMSLGLGLDGADFEAVKEGAGAARWSPFERTLVEAVDELCATSQLGDAGWDALSRELDRQQVMDLLFTVGAYLMLTLAFNAMRIEREPELKALAAQYGAP